jgi:hypothetical protein
MSLSSLPLSYCTNVHPGRQLAEVLSGLRQYTVPLRRAWGGSLAAGLWLAAPVMAELRSAEAVTRLRETLAEGHLTCHTLNAFPYGDFHSRRVKEQVYLPDWTHANRQQYTLDCARVLGELLPEGVEGSISTVPLGFKELPRGATFIDDCQVRLLQTAQGLDRLWRETGRMIRLAIEPEPLCVLETTPETVAFFEGLFAAGARQGLEELARRHLGVCYDVCHQAVEFEPVAASIDTLHRAGVRLNKIHLSSAIELRDPQHNREGREALARYVEERYLHQTVARLASGTVLRKTDLTRELALDPPAEFRMAERWRIHFHVPVNAESLGPLHTTRAELGAALEAVAKLPYAPHLEVETYTWEVLPEGGPGSTTERSPEWLVAGLTRELTATAQMLAESGRARSGAGGV